MKSNKVNKSGKGRAQTSGLSGFSTITKELQWGFLLILLLTLIAYFPVFNHEFTNWDDPIYVTGNDLIKTGAFSEFWTTPIASNYHPLTMLSLALDYRLFGDNPAGFFAVNLILHLTNTLLLGWIMFNLFPKKEILSLTVAGLFALHPLHIESVAWISERKDVLYVFFFFLAWISWIKWENTQTPAWSGLTLLFFILSCLSKGMAVVFPAVIIVGAWMRDKNLSKKYLIHSLPLWLTSILFGIIAIQTQSDAGALSIDNVQLGFNDRVITALHGYVFYLQKMILPINLSAYYPYPVNFNVNWPLPFIVAPFIILLIIGLLWFKFRQNRIILAGGLWYLGILLPVSQIISVGNAMVADRYFYLASIGPFLILAWFIQNFAEQNQKKNLAFSILIGVALLLSVLTRERVKVWENTITMFTDVIKKYPASAVAYHGLGEAYNSKQMYNEALEQFNLALKYRPGYPDVLYNIAVVYDKLNQPQKAIPYYHDALKNKPNYIQALYNLANSYYMAKNYDSSVYWFEATLKQKPDHVGALNNMANIYFDIQDFDKALDILKRTIEINPNQEEALYNIGSIYFQRKEYESAVGMFEKCMQLNAALPDNYRMAGLAYAESGNMNKAIPYLQKAASLGDEISRQWLAGKGM
jgi:tetratricopeptide (TPR) repeat protein